MQKNIEKKLEGFVRAELSGIVQRIQMMNGTMYLALDKPADCDFVPAESEIPLYEGEKIRDEAKEESDIDIALNLEAGSKEGK